MAKAIGPRYKVHFRRRREGRTNYVKRLKLLKSKLPRLVVRKTNSRIIASITLFDEKGDKTITTVEGRHLSKLGWKGSRKSIAAGYLVGLLLGKKAKEAKIEKAVLDMGLHTPTKNNFAFFVALGFKEAGVEISIPDDLDLKRIECSKTFDKSMFERIKSKILGDVR